MVDQISYSVKLDCITSNLLEGECYATGLKRNRLINIAIMRYVEMMDLKRSIAQIPISDKQQAVLEWFRKKTGADV